MKVSYLMSSPRKRLQSEAISDLEVTGLSLKHRQEGLVVPSRHITRPLEQPATPPCQEQHPLEVRNPFCVTDFEIGLNVVQALKSKETTTTTIFSFMLSPSRALKEHHLSKTPIFQGFPVYKNETRYIEVASHPPLVDP